MRRLFVDSYDVEDRGYSSPCWIWHGLPNADGYGMWRDKGAHRAFYEMFVAPIPEGLVIDHLCRVRICVNPQHMEVVTSVENVRRGFGPWMLNARKTHCDRGHEYDEENTRITPDGKRQCRTCACEFTSEYRERLRADSERWAEYLARDRERARAYRARKRAA